MDHKAMSAEKSIYLCGRVKVLFNTTGTPEGGETTAVAFSLLRSRIQNVPSLMIESIDHDVFGWVCWQRVNMRF